MRILYNIVMYYLLRYQLNYLFNKLNKNVLEDKVFKVVQLIIKFMERKILISIFKVYIKFC